MVLTRHKITAMVKLLLGASGVIFIAVFVIILFNAIFPITYNLPLSSFLKIPFRVKAKTNFVAVKLLMSFFLFTSLDHMIIMCQEKGFMIALRGYLIIEVS